VSTPGNFGVPGEAEVAAFEGQTGQVAYAAAKAGIAGPTAAP
jgi:hypothetical protein